MKRAKKTTALSNTARTEDSRHSEARKRRSQQDKFTRRLPTPATLEDRLNAHFDFLQNTPREEAWLAERIVDLDLLLGLIEGEAEAMLNAVDSAPYDYFRPDSLMLVTDAGRLHRQRRRMAQLAQEVERVLQTLHRHPLLRDEVAAIAPLQNGKAERVTGKAAHLKTQMKLMQLVTELNRMAADVRRLRRRMALYKGIKRSVQKQVAVGEQLEGAKQSFLASRG